MTAIQVRKYFHKTGLFLFGITRKQILWCQLHCKTLFCAEGVGGKFAGPNRTILAETNLLLCEHCDNYIADFSAAFLVMYHHEELLQNPEIRRMKLLGRRRVKLVGRKMTSLSRLPSGNVMLLCCELMQIMSVTT